MCVFPGWIMNLGDQHAVKGIMKGVDVFYRSIFSGDLSLPFATPIRFETGASL